MSLRKKKVSLKDIAQQVGVSTALVSYVLNNKREDRISKEVAKKIRSTAKKMNYRTNQIARSLKTNKTATLGLIVADISNPFFSQLARFIEDQAAAANYTVIFASSDENEQKSQNLINVFLDRQVDGLIIAPAENTKPQIRALQRSATPFVLVDRYFPDLKCSYVALDNFQAAREAVRHLIREGNRRIGLITFKTSFFHINERRNGYLSALREAGIPINKKWIREINMADPAPGIKKAVADMLALPTRPEALFFSTNMLYIQGMIYLRQQGIKVPDEIAIVSFDETEASELFDVPPTYIRQPIREMGQQATRILIENIERRHTRQVHLPGELIINTSSIRR
ncbi:MAG: substrate-binding domain-containing protein [Chitinophagaceae bacterium]|nr:substrate-binding domain-containing protein [Chitinophagaceae bacterium]